MLDWEGSSSVLLGRVLKNSSKSTTYIELLNWIDHNDDCLSKYKPKMLQFLNNRIYKGLDNNSFLPN